ncbi:hypothetical protein [Gynuella sp.]|uniref:hypothetical protein n=1 Tax=Gynuella sp. TaxID=2969146 RepID=UPI003D13D0F6
MSKDDSGVHRRTRKTEFSQVVNEHAQPSSRRRNSMPLPPQHGGRVLPMLRPYEPRVRGGNYWYHVTTPANFELIQQSGGLIPRNLQPRRGMGLDESTGRNHQSDWGHEIKDLADRLSAARLDQQLDFLGDKPPELHQMIQRNLQQNLQRTAHEGLNPENLYMSSDIGSSQDYLASQSFMDEGAHIIRVPRAGTGGFVRDVQGKDQDYRSLGRVISSRHMEHVELSPEQVRDLYDKPSDEFSAQLNWKRVAKPKAKAVPFTWRSGGCSTEERMNHGYGPGRGPGPGGVGGGSGIKT